MLDEAWVAVEGAARPELKITGQEDLLTSYGTDQAAW
jgi:hypothetical protein